MRLRQSRRRRILRRHSPETEIRQCRRQTKVRHSRRRIQAWRKTARRLRQICLGLKKAEAPKYETVATVHVEQPEELPEKVTNQLLSKLVEGVKEFEIHIEPANLGKLAIKVLYEGSQATISIVCSEKRALDVLGQNAREIGNIIERNLGEETTIIVEKQETDYLNQTRDENEQANQEQQKQKENGKNQDNEDAGDFLQKLRLGLAG